MENDRDHALLSRFWALHAAVLRRDGLEERLRLVVAPDRDLLERSLAAAEGVLTARAALFRHLMDIGWTPPESVVKDLLYDETVLSETGGAAG